MGYPNLKPEQSNTFFKRMEERYGKKSALLATNLEYEDWYNRPSDLYRTRNARQMQEQVEPQELDPEYVVSSSARAAYSHSASVGSRYPGQRYGSER